MINLAAAEWTKLRTTASFWWTSGLIGAIPIALAAVFGASDSETSFAYVPLTVIMSVATVTTLVVTVQAAMCVTTEYRYGIQATNFRIAPARWQVAVVKLVLYAVLAAFLTFIALAAAFTIGDALAYNSADWTSNSATTRALWAVPAAAALVVVFSQGVGWIVRNTAGALTLIFATQFVAEIIIGLIPKVGKKITDYLPFSNLYSFMYNVPVTKFSPEQGVAIFVAWAVVAWVVGVVLLHTRDA